MRYILSIYGLLSLISVMFITIIFSVKIHFGLIPAIFTVVSLIIIAVYMEHKFTKQLK